MDKITFCIPTKNNLEYLKLCIPSIRKNAFRKDHDIIVFVDADEDGSTLRWLTDNKEYYDLIVDVNPSLGEKLFGIGEAYDYCINKSTTEIFMIFHADMVLGKDADLHAFNALEKKTVVCATRIEPPLHPTAGEKIIRNFGIWPAEFKLELFNEYVEDQLKETRVTDGIFAPWMMYKEEYLSNIGGHDKRLKSAREDSDVFNRLLLAGFEFRQVWNSLVYHFTGRGGQFQHGQVSGAKSAEWRALMNNSTREFIRKWGSNVKHTPMMRPQVPAVYEKYFYIENCNDQLLEMLEPWATVIYSDLKDYDPYILKEQSNTSYLLAEKLKTLKDFVQQDYEDDTTLIHIDGETFNTQDYNFVQMLNEIIEQATVTSNGSAVVGTYKLGTIKVGIQDPQDIKHTLIKN